MKMVMAVVPSSNAEDVLDALINRGHTATYANTKGGMLRQSQFSLFIAVSKEKLDEVLEIIKRSCRTQVEMSIVDSRDEDIVDMPPVVADLGGAIAFVWDINRIETF
ncbi:MAG: cyclic-di-AMP receptor [Chloroflexota bacterium]|nr:cyclic-di-AMP receptor [Chloroflexota bacterium]